MCGANEENLNEIFHFRFFFHFLFFLFPSFFCSLFRSVFDLGFGDDVGFFLIYLFVGFWYMIWYVSPIPNYNFNLFISVFLPFSIKSQKIFSAHIPTYSNIKPKKVIKIKNLNTCLIFEAHGNWPLWYFMCPFFRS
jgi:hypothetical protein